MEKRNLFKDIYNMAKESSRAFNLHPLVLVNVSDHHVRMELSNDNNNKSKVMGMLFGYQDGQTVHIQDSHEFLVETNSEGQVFLNMDFIKKKQELYVAVFPKIEIIGWYVVGKDVTDEDMAIHRSLSEVNESPLLLLVDAEISQDMNDLPIKLLESVMQLVKDVPTMIFMDVPFVIHTFEPERITVDSICKGGGGGTLSSHVNDLHNSVNMLRMRIRGIQKYLAMLKSGEVPMNHEVLRQVASVADKLPLMNSDQFGIEFEREYNDSMMVSYLAALTKSAGMMSELQTKIGVLHDTTKSRPTKKPRPY